MTKKILFLTDADFRGSGYMYVSMPICEELSKLGYEVRMIGMGYQGEPHKFNFSIIPCQDFQDARQMIVNLNQLQEFDVLIIALDIPLQLFFIDKLRGQNIKQIAITPLENPPLTKSWMMGLSQLDAVFFISEIATQAAHDAGLAKAQHLRIGVDTKSWRLPTPDERTRIRKSMGVDENFVILTVADNQERKNPVFGYDIVSKVKAAGVPVKYIHVTREHNPQGMNLRDYAELVGINKDLMIVERGIPSSELMSLYFAADAFLLPTKAEGLGLPVLEAMACGVPVVATDTGAVHELLMGENGITDRGNGYLICPEYSFIDIWGNSRRDLIDRDEAVSWIRDIHDRQDEVLFRTMAARTYVEERTWDAPVKLLSDTIEEICNVENKEQ